MQSGNGKSETTVALPRSAADALARFQVEGDAITLCRFNLVIARFNAASKVEAAIVGDALNAIRRALQDAG